jgi:hypothetical protein
MISTIKSPSPVIKLASYSLLIIAIFIIFLIAQSIKFYLNKYDLDSMYISFCAGFVCFIPLISLILHPIIFIDSNKNEKSNLAILLANASLVMVVQALFFLIWMTDAIAIYSIYVDQNSFLAKAFDITSERHGDLSVQFYWVNIFLACLFAWLSLIIGVMPCLIARVDNKGVVKNFVASFSFAKRFKLKFFLSAVVIALAAIMPLLYLNYMFLISFPLILTTVVLHLAQLYLNEKI